MKTFRNWMSNRSDDQYEQDETQQTDNAAVQDQNDCDKDDDPLDDVDSSE